MRAIDVHVHPSTRGLDCDACAYFRRELSEVPTTEEKFAELFVTQQVKALLSVGIRPLLRMERETAMSMSLTWSRSIRMLLRESLLR